ncbi:MAG TPA: hypothetical protein VD998_03805, partial [Verrucomicrobiae bacterium]|nr:hypothetical protein [Verrucomicrobiae bacterium]
PVTVLGTPDASPELEFLVKNQLVSAARIPAEVAFFVESLIAGKKLTNPQQVLSALSVTTVEKDLMEALGTLKPPGTVKVQNYQEN